MKTQQEFVDAMTGMFGSRGWLEFFKPELQALRSGLLDELIYNQAAVASPSQALDRVTASVQLLDQILGCEDRVRAAAKAIQDNPEEAVNVLQSSAVED